MAEEHPHACSALNKHPKNVDLDKPEMSVRFISGEELNESKALEKPNTVDPHSNKKRKYMSQPRGGTRA